MESGDVMLSWFRKNRDSETASLIRELSQQMDFRFSEISAQIKELEHGLEQMESRLLTKDLKDKQAYGLLHYKLHEVKSSKITEEIETLEKALASKKLPVKDH